MTHTDLLTDDSIVGFPPAVDVGEEIPMTMQVGMVGTDGVLLASDTQWNEEIGMVRGYTNAHKIKTNDECGVAISQSGKMVTAGYLADAIIAATLEKRKWFCDEVDSKQKIEKKVLAFARPGSELCQCLVAFTQPDIQLWRFQTVEIRKSWELVGEQSFSKIYAGDCKNASIFWGERYYPRQPRVPIRTLVPLAAHLIIAAHPLNTSGVSGLEIVLCDKNGITRLTDEEISGLELRASEMDKEFGDSLLSQTA